MNCTYYNKIRKHIYKNFKIIDILLCDNDKFIDTEQKTIIFVIQKKDFDLSNNNKFTIDCEKEIYKQKNMDVSLKRQDETNLVFNTPENIKKLKDLCKQSTNLYLENFNVCVGNVVWNQCKNEIIYGPYPSIYKVYKNVEKGSKKILIENSEIKSGTYLIINNYEYQITSKKSNEKNKKLWEYTINPNLVENVEKGCIITIKSNNNSRWYVLDTYNGRKYRNMAKRPREKDTEDKPEIFEYINIPSYKTNIPDTLGKLTHNSNETLLVYTNNIKNNKLIWNPPNLNKDKTKANYIKKQGNTNPLLIINRGYGNADYKFNYCLIDIDKPYLIENHLICIKYTGVLEKQLLKSKYEKIIESFKDQRTMDFIKLYFSNNAINTTELNHLLPIYGLIE